MPQSKPSKTHQKSEKNDMLIFGWHRTWIESVDSAEKLQRIWFETYNDAIRHEIEFLVAMAVSYSRITSCILNYSGRPTKESMTSCYQEIADDMTEATLKRFRKVSELSDELRERIWCEI